MDLNYRNAKRISGNRIDCEIDHPIYGWIPFTCDPTDTGAPFDVAALHALMDADPNTAPYIPPTQAELDAAAAAEARAVSLSKIDFCRALYAAQILPADLVVDAARGKWPATFEAAIAGLPEAAQVDAKLAWAGATHVSRTAPLFLSLLAFFANAQGLSPEQAETLGDQIFGISA